ncbi:MAG: FAD:protein FMN transferase [Thermodesulfovibrionales bacterium]|nr:FAD:protein FMN transferase [Thermodesulfovibrionales bacterium]
MNKTLASLFLLCVVFLGCVKQERIYKETRSAMYTITTITVTANDKDTAKKAIDDAFIEIERLERMLNYYDDKSEIAKINRNAGISPVKVSSETFELVFLSIKASEMTEGGFDITAGPIIRLWDFKTKRIPSKEDIKRNLSLVGYRSIIMDKANSTVFISKKGMEINPGGIIKGYASEKVSQLLISKGIKSGVVAIGGDIKTFGLKPDGKGWIVGIQHPRPQKSKDELLGSLELSNQCISTSGDYEKFFEVDGIRYHHILNLKTGYPAQGMMSVTVVTDNAAMCDALATGLFTMGVEKAMQTMKKYGIEGLIVDEKGQSHPTDLFLKRMIKI